MQSIISIQSHVVFGCAGNSAAVFPMQRLGMDVWPINTVQFSNHTQYAAGWQGMVMPAGHITALIQGLNNINKLPECDAILSGYLGSAAQGHEILEAVSAIKALNPDAIYFCDPVMGHREKGCIVALEMAQFFSEFAVPAADIIAPNLLELETLWGKDMRLTSLSMVRTAAHEVMDRCGISMVVVKHLGRAAQDPHRFEMLLVSRDGDYLIHRPLYPFINEPVGVGDLISGLMLGNLLAGHDAIDAFERTNSAVDMVLRHTWQAGANELQLVLAQAAFVDPKIKVQAKRL